MPGTIKFELRSPVAPYVCSTPLDFAEERQYLSEVVFPQLNDLCKVRGSYFSAVDLRWEPGDQRAQGGLLLKNFLDMIKRCSPFFMCLLGETYGPHRDENDPPLVQSRNGRSHVIPEGCNWLDRNLLIAGTGGYPWVLQEGHQSSSIPELEVTQGAFLCDNPHITFYYRQSNHLDDKLCQLAESGNETEKEATIARYSAESEYAKIKIHDLRQRLVNKGVPVKYFRTLEELGQVVIEDWMEIIDMVLPPLPHDEALLDSMEYREWQAQESFIRSRSKVFVSTEEVEGILQQMTEFALSCGRAEIRGEGEDIFTTVTSHSKIRGYSATAAFKKRPAPINHGTSIMLLSGDRGVGKSALAAQWLNEFRGESCHACVIPHFVSASSSSGDIVEFLHECIRQLRREYLLSDAYDPNSIYATIESEGDGDGKNLQSLTEAFIAALSLGPCVILLDGLNELMSAHGITAQEVKEFSWLPEILPATCKFIFTTTRSDISHRSLAKRRDVVVLSFPSSLTDANTTAVMLKEHIPNITQLIGGEQALRRLAHLKIMQTALGSRVVENEVTCYRVYSNMAAFMENNAEIWSLRDFWIMCVKKWVQDHSWTVDNPSSEMNFVDSGFDYAGWVTDSLCLIAVSRNGLKSSQILSILKMIGYEGELEVTAFDWLQFRLSAGTTLREQSDGRLVFGHRYLLEIAEYLLFKSMSSISYDPVTIVKSCHSGMRQAYHGHLARFFSQQLLSSQVMEELPWQLMLSGEITGLLDYLTDCGALLKMLAAHNDLWLQDLKLYWSVCQLRGHHPGSVYLQLTHALGVVDISDVQMLEDCFSQPGGITPTPRLVISTPQPLQDYVDEEQENYREEEGGLCGSPILVGDVETPSKCKISEDETMKDDFEDGVFVTQGGFSSGLPPPIMHVNGTDKENFPGVVSLCWHLAGFLQQLGQMEARRVLLSSVIKYIKQNYPLTLEQHLVLCRCHHAIGKLYEGLNDLVMAEKEYRLALHAQAAADDMDDELEYQTETQYLKGLLLCCHGNIRIREEDLYEAEELLKEALECIEDNPDCYVLKSNIYLSLGLLRSSQLDFLRAESCLRQSAKLRSQWFGRCHPFVSEVVVALAKLLATPSNTKGRDVAQAENLFRQALSIQERCLGVSHLSVAGVLFELGELLAEEKSHPAKMEAQKYYRRSLDIRTTELGGNHPLTVATQQSLTRLDVALKLGHYEFGSSKHSDRRSNSMPFSTLTFRESDLSRLQSRTSSQGAGAIRIDDPMMVRAVSREEVMKHNRPDSMVSSVISLTSASERLLSAPVTNRPRLLRREKENQSRQAIWPNAPENYDDLNKRNSDVIIIGSLDSKGRRLVVGNEHTLTESEFGETMKNGSCVEQADESGVEGGGPDQVFTNGPLNSDRKMPISVEIQQKGEATELAGGDYTDVLDTPRLESYADATSQQGVYGDKKTVTLRPSSAPRRMFQRFGKGEAVKPASAAGSKRGGQHSNRLWSGHSNMTAVSSATSGHYSRCNIPGRHDITPSNANTIGGPHSSLSSLLGDPPCPRPSSNKMHHRSAWYHIPGRYITPQERYPKKRMQKTENAKDIESFIAMKSQWAKKRQQELQEAKLRELQQQEQENHENAQSSSQSYKKILRNSSSTHKASSYMGNRMYGVSMFGGGRKLVSKSKATPRLMISGLDMVPEARYPENHGSSQNHVVKFKEPIFVG